MNVQSESEMLFSHVHAQEHTHEHTGQCHPQQSAEEKSSLSSDSQLWTSWSQEKKLTMARPDFTVKSKSIYHKI